MNTFKASVQYNDLVGTAAADRSDDNDATSWLRSNGHISQEEFVVGISLFVGENHGQHVDPVSARFLIAEMKAYDEYSPINVRELHKDLSISDFLAMFKRLSIAISMNGMLNGREYSITEEQELN